MDMQLHLPATTAEALTVKSEFCRSRIIRPYKKSFANCVAYVPRIQGLCWLLGSSKDGAFQEFGRAFYLASSRDQSQEISTR